MSRTLITQNLSTQNPPDPSNPTAIPTSLSLSIPFFSRSSSSSQTYSTDLDTSSSSYSDISPGLGIDINPNYLYNPQASSLDLRKSTSSSSSRSSVRPGLKKMPSWNNQTWSPRTSQDVYIRRASEQSESSSPTDGEFVFDSGASGHGRRKSLINIDFGTWSKKPKIIFSGKKKSLSISKLKLKSKSTLTTTTSRSGERPVQVEDEIVSAKDTFNGIPNITFSPLQRVWARSEEEDVDRIDRHRRGSDWPPTQSREMYLDLSGIPTFTGENDQSDNGLFEQFSKFNFTSMTGMTGMKAQSSQTPSVQLELEGGRVDTPLEMPVRPRLNLRLRKSHSSSILSPFLDTEEEEEEEEVMYMSSTVKDDNKLEKEQSIDNRVHSQAGVEKEAQGQELQQEQEEEYFTPCFIPSSSFVGVKTTYPTKSNDTVQTSTGSEEESPIFDLSIFSPRPALPNAPVLKGIVDTLPISPLELPSSTSLGSVASFKDIALSFPTPILSKDPPSSPIVMPIPRKGISIPHQSIESVLNPYPCSTINRRSSLTDRRPSRPSTTIEGIPTTRRRMSLILKPAILPCPTPPSLLTSPKTLGSEYIPPLFSPNSTSPTSSLFINTTTGIGGLPVRRGRGSLKLKLPSSHFANSTGLGFGPEKDEREEEKEEHVPTPGTFGLEGEKERFGNEGIDGINPYFA
ncbi:hypothetical protein I204_01056 [Kwoniella mangroviensis CBS 8886]|nr:hypothetical protein I204_01056 [Kwoniella mangroviensis CBS 8886]